MARITHARKVERITEVKLESGSAELTISENAYNRDEFSVAVKATNPAVDLLDELLRFAQPQENECPPREITLQSLIDEMQRKRDNLNEKWGSRQGQPTKQSIEFGIDRKDAQVVIAVLKGGDMDYNVTTTVREALTGQNGW